MKKIIISMFLTVLAIQLNGQALSASDNSAIDKRVESFLELIEAKSYTKLLDFMYPRIFEHTSKKSMFQVFDLLEQAGIELKFNNLEVLNKKALPSENNIKYALIKYRMDMELPLTTDDLKGMAPLMVPMLTSNFGKGNVEYNKAENYIKVKGEKFLLGIDDPEYNEWLFLIYDDSFKTAIARTIPPKVNQAAASSAY